MHEDHSLSSPDAPSKTLTRNTHGDGGVIRLSGGALRTNNKHRPNTPDEPSMTVTSKGDGRGAQGACVLDLGEAPPRRKRPPSTKGKQWERVGDLDAPAATVLSDTDAIGHSSPKLPWPWDRPSTTIMGDERMSVPGHHDPSVPNSIHRGPNAIILSEAAAAILQGFPRRWRFTGKTKKARWSQIGMAMPPPLARAVATSIVAARGDAVRRRRPVDAQRAEPEAPPQASQPT
jgi:site-specific DNA-cytosine methylase